jgi:hypothetical protein
LENPPRKARKIYPIAITAADARFPAFGRRGSISAQNAAHGASAFRPRQKRFLARPSARAFRSLSSSRMPVVSWHSLYRNLSSIPVMT